MEERYIAFKILGMFHYYILQGIKYFSEGNPGLLSSALKHITSKQLR